LNTKKEGLGVEMLDLLVDRFQKRRPEPETLVQQPRHHNLMRSFMATAVETIGLLLLVSLAERLRPERERRVAPVAAAAYLKHRSDKHHERRP